MAISQTVPKLVTVGVIASALDVPIHRVLHVVNTRDHIGPSARAGNLRLFNRAAIGQVRHELDLIDERRYRKQREMQSA